MLKKHAVICPYEFILLLIDAYLNICGDRQRNWPMFAAFEEKIKPCRNQNGSNLMTCIQSCEI
jgi:hypothetical protein